LARKILLADDSVTAQNMGRKILGDAGYDVVTVNNGSAALKRVTELKPDLIVLDVYMPGYSGLEVCQRLKDSPDTERIPVLLTVGKLEPFKPEEARRVRADAYIIKPFEASELLSALACMEDRMVPGPGDGSRFSATNVRERYTEERPSTKSESDADPDTGWKSRLRFPSKKKKEEPEPESETEFAPELSFRTFRRGKSKVSNTAPGKSAPSPQEPAVVPDIPRDITPEELDALSALAAKLDGPAATEEQVSTPSGMSTPVESSSEFEVAAPAVEEKSAALEPRGEPEIPAVNAVSEASAAVIAPEPAAVPEAGPAERVHVETFAVVEPAPVDRQDEPTFATAAIVEETVPEEQKIEVSQAPVIGSDEVANPAQMEDPAPDQPKIAEVSKAEEPVAEVTAKIEEPPKPAEAPEVPVVAAAGEAETGSAPSEEELEEALRLLTPSLGHTDASSISARQTLVAAGAELAERAAQNASQGPRWVAAAVTVSPEEAALSLEAEMFRTLANPSAQANASAAPGATAAMSPAPVESGVTAEVTTWASPETRAAVPDAASEVAAKEPEAATLADAVQRDEIEVASAQPGAVPVGNTAVPAEEVGPPVAETMAVATSEAAGDEDAMAKERANTGKSNWHQIRTGSPSGTPDLVEAAKQAGSEEEAPKAMAAAASGASAGTSPAMPDPSAIASIVDSVLADLRPKIVEEIARKLAGK